MICPYCKSKDLRVIDSREADESVRRRRECVSCKKRFTTYERVEKTDLTVIKKDGRKEGFNPEKLIAGILKACEKRPITEEKIDRLCEEIEAKLKKRENMEVSSSLIGDMAMTRLKKLDEVAYVRFASVCKDFKHVKEFGKEIRELKAR